MNPPTASGVSDNGLYRSDVTITFASTVTATLDGIVFSSGGVVSAEGDHSLVLTNRSNGMTTTINFTIDKSGPTATVESSSATVLEFAIGEDLYLGSGDSKSPINTGFDMKSHLLYSAGVTIDTAEYDGNEDKVVVTLSAPAPTDATITFNKGNKCDAAGNPMAADVVATFDGNDWN